MEYPYYKNYVTEEKIKKDFTRLKNMKSTLTRPTNRLCRLHILNTTDEITKITDYFSEECRVKCSFRKNPPPIQKFQDLKDNPVFDSRDYSEIEKYLYKNARGCNNFDVKVGFQIMKYLKPKHILDFSAGWGDRLIASMAYGCKYDGVDPSRCLHPKYKKMINSLVPESRRSHYKMHRKGFEDFNPEKGKYDMVLTSPPFFDLEIYEDSKYQSTSKFTSFESWKENFLFTSLEKSVECLGPGGIVALYITDYTSGKGEKFRYVGDVKNKLSSLGMAYQGNICFSNVTSKTKIRIIYVWQKLD